MKYHQRITKTKPFKNKYNWVGTNFPSEEDDWKKFEKNNVAVALNISYTKKNYKYPADVSKHNSLKSNKTSYSFNDYKWRMMTLCCSKKLSALLRGITTKHHGDFYYLNCLHSFAIEKNLNCTKKYEKIMIFVI